MQVRLISTLDELQTLAHAWNALAGEAPFRSWDWLATWWKHYGTATSNDKLTDGKRLFVFAVFADTGSENPDLVGIAPWYIERSLVSGNVVRSLGDGEVCTDHSTIICRPEHRSAVCAAIAEALINTHNDWDRLDLTAIDTTDANVECLLASLAENECTVSRQPAVATWELELPASWEDYLASISKSHRKQLRQLVSRVLETDRVKLHRVLSQSDLETAWPIFVDLHQRRRISFGEPGCFASQTFHDFHLEVASRLLDRGQLRLSWLELDGTPAAAEYHFAGAAATYAYQGGVDPDRLEEEPGRLSTILFLRAAIEEGHGTLDFLRGDEAYKAHWRATPYETFDARVTPNRRLARLRTDVRNATERVTDWVRQSAKRLGN